MKNIVFVGFMGTGKTQVAKRLAERIGKNYISIDKLIEARENKTISDIFQDQGEAYFRRVERQVVKETLEKDNQIIDTGGGVVLDNENMENLKKNGIIICLWASEEVIHERTRHSDKRPLLNVPSPLGRIKEILDKRRSFYRKADFHVDTTHLSLEDVVGKVERIIDEIEKEKDKRREKD